MDGSQVVHDTRQSQMPGVRRTARNVAAPAGDLAEMIKQLQRTAGNQAVNALLARYSAGQASTSGSSGGSIDRCAACAQAGAEEDGSLQRAIVQRMAVLQRDDDEEDPPATSTPTTVEDPAPGDPPPSSDPSTITDPSSTPTTDPSSSADPSSSTDTQPGGSDTPPVVVQENFQPSTGGAAADENLVIAVVGPGQQPEQDEAAAAPRLGFVDGGRIGTARYGDSPPRDHHVLYPMAFTNGGRTGTVVWAGGGGAGAHGNEGTGSIQATVAPAYESRSNGLLSDSDAWVQAGTGTIDVTRSWVGINAGNQGNGHFVTAAAAARINQHETLHVASTQRLYNTHIQPLLARVVSSTFNPSGGFSMSSARTQSGAIDKLRTSINWAGSVSAFQAADQAENNPMASTDTNDIASGTYPVDAGPGTVAGTAFQHRVRTPSEPNPA